MLAPYPYPVQPFRLQTFSYQLPPQNPPQIHSSQLRKKIHNYSFLLTDKIGRGYSSVVYRGMNDLTKQTVAVKVVELKSLKDETSRQMLDNELQCIRGLNHPNLLAFIDAFFTVNNCYIITEYCAKGDLAKELNSKKIFTQTETKQIFLQIYQGYIHFHAAGYIHRDLKPANIFIDQKNQFKLADFGFVKKMTFEDRETYNVGTPIYMAPESALENRYNEKSQIWSLGILTYELVYGETPFKGKSERELKRKIDEANLTFPPLVEISNELKDFLQCCLMRQPNKRISLKQMRDHPWLKKCRNERNEEITAEKVKPEGSMLHMNNILTMKSKCNEEDKENIPQNAKPSKRSSMPFSVDSLTHLVNYFRFIYKTLKQLSDCKLKQIGPLKECLRMQLVRMVRMHIAAKQTGANVFQIDQEQWDRIVHSDAWPVYQHVIGEYEEKYRGELEGSQEVSIQSYKAILKEAVGDLETETELCGKLVSLCEMLLYSRWNSWTVFAKAYPLLQEANVTGDITKLRVRLSTL